jgi:hypothetical protein
MDNTLIKKQILDAIDRGEYEVSIEGPNNIAERTKYDGSVYYFMYGDDAGFGTHPGYCTVSILNYTFTCDLETGDWDDDCDLGDDIDDIIEAIEGLDGVIYGEHYDTESYMDIYYAANPDAPEGVAYGDWSDDLPKDIDDLGYDDAYIDVKYGNKEVECTITDQQLYDLYLHVCDEDNFNEGIELSSDEIKECFEEIHKTILEQISENEEETDTISYAIAITPHTFEWQLG